MRRFWTDVIVEAGRDGYRVLLDKRTIKSPSKADLLLPHEAMARAVAAEWDAVEEKIDPARMPVTGFANAALDRIAPDRATFVEAIAAFGETDLFCYHAEAPEELIQRQREIWGKWLAWAQSRYLVNFTVVRGIMHEKQPNATTERLKAAVAELSIWQLAAASKLTHLSGSLIATLALTEGEADPAALWHDLILDEYWQEEKWGADEYAIKNRRDREADFLNAAAFMKLAGISE
ncbi:ATP12 family chaperone protein [Sphingorhabdus arenilitoris]|uniref:ATP12 family chaperone protein n=1 Tax=Sphingorhabdus arenilitoris TaxID=1490041 RepID=A0ABV8RF38_9SPHN